MAYKKSKSTKKFIKKKKKNIKGLMKLGILVIVLIILWGTGFGIYHIMTNNKFNITRINVTDCQRYTKEDIINASELSLGENIFKISKKKIADNIEKLPYVESCEIDRHLPSTLQLNITERTGKYVAYAKDSGQYVRLDKYGVILEVIDVSKMEEETLIFGVNFDDAIELGQKITELENNKLEVFEKIKNMYMENEIEKKITSVEFKDSNIILTINDKINVILQDDNELEYNISFLKTILKEIEEETGTLDMTQENPTFSAI